MAPRRRGPREGPPAGAAGGQDGGKAEAIHNAVLVYPKITKNNFCFVQLQSKMPTSFVLAQN